MTALCPWPLVRCKQPSPPRYSGAGTRSRGWLGQTSETLRAHLFSLKLYSILLVFFWGCLPIQIKRIAPMQIVPSSREFSTQLICLGMMVFSGSGRLWSTGSPAHIPQFHHTSHPSPQILINHGLLCYCLRLVTRLQMTVVLSTHPSHLLLSVASIITSQGMVARLQIRVTTNTCLVVRSSITDTAQLGASYLIVLHTLTQLKFISFNPPNLLYWLYLYIQKQMKGL